MTQNLKSNTKLTHVYFFETLTCLFHPQSTNYLRKYNHFFFLIFSKMHILLYYLHLPQVFTILSLPTIYQPPWTTNLKLLMHLKIDLHSFILHFYELKTSFSLSLHIHPKNPKILILKFLWFIEPLKLTILRCVTFVWDSWFLEKTYVCKQVISLVKTMKSVFSQICSSRRLTCTWKSSG